MNPSFGCRRTQLVNYMGSGSGLTTIPEYQLVECSTYFAQILSILTHNLLRFVVYMHCGSWKMWQYICYFNSGKTRSIFRIFAPL